MIPILYDKTFSTKHGDLIDSIKCEVTEERNGEFSLSLTYPSNSNLLQYFENDAIIVANASDTLLNQKFRIYKTRKLMANKIEVLANHISFDSAHDIIPTMELKNQTCEYCLNQIFKKSQFSTHYRGYSDITHSGTFKIDSTNPVNAIAGTAGSIISTFGNGAEIKRDNTDIYVLAKRGYNRGVEIEYRKNLKGLTLEEDFSSLTTRIIPYATYQDDTGNEAIITGPIVDSQYINHYAHPFVKRVDYSEKYEDGAIPTSESLQKNAEDDFNNNKIDLPKTNFKIEFVPLSKCAGYENLDDKISLCDIVTIKDTRYDINTQAKVIKVVFNVLRDRYEKMELGEPRSSLGDIITTPDEGVQGPQGPAGTPGQDGESAKYVVLTGDQVFRYSNQSSIPTPTSIRIIATPYNITNPTYKWQYKRSDSEVWKDSTNTSSSYNLTHDNDTIFSGDNQAVTLKCIVNNTTFSTITIFKVYDGEAGEPGQDGQTSYLHIKYSNNNGRTFTTPSQYTYQDYRLWEYGQYSMTNGNKEPYDGRIRLKELVPITPSSTYVFDTFNDNYRLVIRVFNENKEFVRTLSAVENNAKVTFQETDYYLGVILYTPLHDNTTLADYIKFLRNCELIPVIAPYDSSYVLGDEVGKYIGTLVSFSKIPSANSRDYKWARLEGEAGDFPDETPEKPTLTAQVYGFGAVDISWTFENKIYYSYELYASRTKDFTPNTFDLIYAGKGSSYSHQIEPGDTWYYKVCGINTHGTRGEFSDQASATGKKIDDASNYFESASIGDALIGQLSLDRGWFGTLKGQYLDVRNLTVTNGNGEKTFWVDAEGNVRVNAKEINLAASGTGNVVTTDVFEEANTAINQQVNDVIKSNELTLDYIHLVTSDNHITAAERGSIKQLKDEIVHQQAAMIKTIDSFNNDYLKTYRLELVSNYDSLIEAMDVIIKGADDGLINFRNLLTLYYNAYHDCLYAISNLTKDGLNDLKSEINVQAGKIDMVISQSGIINNDIALIKQHMTFTAQGWLELYGTINGTPSPFKTQLSDTKLSFWDNGQEVAYVSNKKLNIEQAEVRQSLKIGNYIMTKSANNGIVFRKEA